MKRIFLLSLLLCLLTPSCAPLGAASRHPAVHKVGRKAHKESQSRLAASFGRNLHGPKRRAPRRHF